MDTVDLAGWRKSSFCGNAACVEVSRMGDVFLVRDSKDPSGPVLAFTRVEWAAFVAGVSFSALKDRACLEQARSDGDG